MEVSFRHICRFPATMDTDIDWMPQICLFCNRRVLSGAFCSVRCALMDSEQSFATEESRFPCEDGCPISDRFWETRRHPLLHCDFRPQRVVPRRDGQTRMLGISLSSISTGTSFFNSSDSLRQTTPPEGATCIHERQPKAEKRHSDRDPFPKTVRNQITQINNPITSGRYWATSEPIGRISLDDLAIGILCELPSSQGEDDKRYNTLSY